MNKPMLYGVGVAVIGVAAGAVIASHYAGANSPQYADVVNVQPITQDYTVPHQQCRDIQVTHQRPASDSHQLIGTGLGAVVGGLLGHAVGGGRGKTLTTVAGAVGGGYAGHQIEKSQQRNDVYTTTEHQCRTLREHKQRVVAYNVQYRWNGQVQQVRMDQDPGTRIEVKDGMPVLPVTTVQTAPQGNAQ